MDRINQLLLTMMLLTQSGERFVVTETHGTSPIVPQPLVVVGERFVVTEKLAGEFPQVEHREPEPDAGEILGRAIEQSAANRPRKIVVFTQVGCGPCNRMHGEDIAGDDLELEFRQEQPLWLESFPAIWLPDVNRVAYGYHSHAELRAVLARNPVAPKAVQAFTLGSLAIRKHVAAILANVTNRGGQTEIAIGSGVVILPAQMQQTVSITPDTANTSSTAKIVFTGTKPRYRWGSGFLSLGADINSLTLSRTELVVGVNGLSDVKLEVKE